MPSLLTTPTAAEWLRPLDLSGAATLDGLRLTVTDVRATLAVLDAAVDELAARTHRLGDLERGQRALEHLRSTLSAQV